MKVIEIIENGILEEEDISYFGGQYSFWEILKKGGIGSPKVIYISGIEEFDKIKRNVEGEIGYVNFELMKNGLILRININQRIRCVGLKFEDISTINLTAVPVEIKNLRRGKSKFVHKGELEIVEADNKLNFSVTIQHLKGIKKYFQKDELARKFNFSTVNNPSEISEDISN